jgi:hypothetical protein
MYISFDIPEVNRHSKDFAGFWLKAMFISPVSPNLQVRALCTTYMRLVEAALLEYAMGHEALLQFWNTHTSIALGAMHQSISHFEHCLSDTHRARKIFSRLRRHREAGDLGRLLNNPHPNFTRSEFGNKLRDIRNEIHHTEEVLMDGRLGEGDPLMLRANGPEMPHPTEANQTNKLIDRLVVGSRELLFSELSEALNEMGQYCEKISNLVPSSTAAGSA